MAISQIIEIKALPQIPKLLNNARLGSIATAAMIIGICGKISEEHHPGYRSKKEDQLDNHLCSCYSATWLHSLASSFCTLLTVPVGPFPKVD